MNWLTDTVYRRLLGFACWCLGTQQDAMDLVHDGLVATASGNARNQEMYTKGAIYKMAMTRLGSRRFEQLPTWLPSWSDPFSDVLLHERVGWVRYEAAKLSPMSRSVVLRQLAGESREDILASGFTSHQFSQANCRAVSALKERLNA